MSELDNQLTALANAIREIAAPEGTGAMSLDDMATLLGAAEWRDDFLKSLIEQPRPRSRFRTAPPASESGRFPAVLL